ncbi:hypothetical protein [Tepidibacter mesophilus]|uniref:hypothetical protein n=1 Tax=Tepidibacter mesophilus TaxID=655607 RepID=UPI000C067F35|nr:hypothetical protein [Tepidibacter mesophilus]
MRNIKLAHNYSWLFEFESIDDFKGIENLKLVNEIESNIYLYKISRIVNNGTIDFLELKSKIQDKRDYEDEDKILQFLQESIEKEEYCQIILFKDINKFLIICDDIRNWNDYFINTKFRSIEVLNKRIISSILDNGFSDNILSVSFCYEKKLNDMINSVNIHGSNIQHSEKFLDIIHDDEVKTLSCVFQPTNKDYLVTLKIQNKIELSKYISDKDHMEFLKEFIAFISKELSNNFRR